MQKVYVTLLVWCTLLEHTDLWYVPLHKTVTIYIDTQPFEKKKSCNSIVKANRLINIFQLYIYIYRPDKYVL